MSAILVINSGSSSMKYQLIDPASETRLAKGIIERIGESEAGRARHESEGNTTERSEEIADHAAAFELMRRIFADAGQPLDTLEVTAVGHRVVQGGAEFAEPVLIDARVEEQILELGSLAPLHNPGHHRAIVAARRAFPDIPHVAVFDTAFHRTMPPAAWTYAIDRETATNHGVRRYGFHGISYQVVSRRAAELLDRPLAETKQIVLHLGNGASACAIDGGRSVDTSMGLTPLEGLVMGTRGGDLDPGVLLHLLRSGLTTSELERLLNHRSGLQGLAGHNDMRDVRRAAEAGDREAAETIEIAVHRLRHYIGAYLVTLGGADAIVFTAGVGENQPDLRAEVCAGMEWLGVRIDPARNTAATGEARYISTDDSEMAVLVVPTDEELEIARQTRALIAR